MNNFYVYLHKRKTDGAVFYVGKGTKRRAWCGGSRKTSAWKANAVSGFDVEIYKSNLTELDAETLELQLINDPPNSWELVNVLKKSTGIKYIDFSKISEIVYYSPESPSGLVWKVDISRKMKKGKTAGSRKYNYGEPHKWSVCIDGGLLCNHRIVFLLHNPDFDQSLLINHIDCNPHNNKIENLEAVTKKENNERTKMQKLGIPRKDSSTGHIGVSLHITRTCNYYVAYHSKDGKFTRKFFSINSLGAEAALEKAILWRKEHE